MKLILLLFFVNTALFSQVVSVVDFGAVCDGDHDDTTQIQAAFNSSTARIIVFPESGLCKITSGLLLTNKDDRTLVAYGPVGGILIDGVTGGTNIISVAGSNNITIQGLRFVGDGLTTTNLTGIFGNGTTGGRKTYGNIKVIDTHWTNFPGTVLGVGANQGDTAHDISYIRNTIEDCGWRSNGTNTIIDTGAEGTKLRYLIDGNTIRNTDYPLSGTKFPAIFTGHGVNSDFRIVNNQIEGVPGDGITAFDRPIGNEATSYKNAVIAGNVIRNAGGACISIWGGDTLAISGNTCLNPGKVSGAGYGAAGIGLAFGISETTNKPAKNISITGNVLVDDQQTHTMAYGIREASGNTNNETQGTLAGNRISGQITAAYSLLPNTKFLFADPSDYFVARLDAGSSDTSQGYYLAQQWRPKQDAGDEANSGVIDYGNFSSNALYIVGKGTTAGNRSIFMADKISLGGSGATPISFVLSNTALLNFGTIAAQGCSEQEISIDGVAGTDSVYANPVGAFPTAGIIWSAIPGGGKIVVRACNVTSANVAVTTQSWRGVSIRF